jgi:hypothetical protein
MQQAMLPFVMDSVLLWYKIQQKGRQIKNNILA